MEIYVIHVAILSVLKDILLHLVLKEVQCSINNEKCLQ